MLERDGYVCQVQGPGCEHFATVAGHIRARAHGGQATLANYRAECAHCSSVGGAAISRGTHPFFAAALVPGRRPAGSLPHGTTRAKV